MQVKAIFAADDECALLRGRKYPLGRVRSLEVEIRAFIRLEAPERALRPGELGIQFRAFDGVCVDHKSAAGSIRSRWQLNLFAILVWNVEEEIVRNVRREDQRRALDWQNQRRFLQAKSLVCGDGPQRGQLCRFDCRQAHDNHRHRFAERWWIVQLQIHLLSFRPRESRNVYIGCSVKIAENAGEIHDRANIRAVKSASGEWRGADRTA